MGMDTMDARIEKAEADLRNLEAQAVTGDIRSTALPYVRDHIQHLRAQRDAEAEAEERQAAQKAEDDAVRARHAQAVRAETGALDAEAEKAATAVLEAVQAQRAAAEALRVYGQAVKGAAARLYALGGDALGGDPKTGRVAGHGVPDARRVLAWAAAEALPRLGVPVPLSGAPVELSRRLGG